MKTTKKILQALLEKRAIILIVLLFFGAVTIIWLVSSTNSDWNIALTINIAALSALFSALSAVATLFQAEEAKSQRENDERPFVLGHFEPNSNSGIYFIIKNYGKSPAKNVRISFDPIPVDHLNRPLNQLSIFSKPISLLPPSMVHRRFVDTGPNVLKAEKPKNFKIKVTYSSLDNKNYVEEFFEDVSFLTETNLPPKSEADQLGAILSEISDLKKIFQRITTFDSIKVESPDEHSKPIGSMLEDEES